METKICSICGKEKPIEDFPFRDKARGTRRANCKQCHSETMKRKYQENKKIFNEIKKDLHCEKCGYDKCLEALEFHHISPEIKINTVARLAVHSSTKMAKEEMNKCVVLCANCHREFHYLERTQNISLEEFLK